MKKQDKKQNLSRPAESCAHKMTAMERVKELDESCVIYSSAVLRRDSFDLFNTLLLFPIARQRFIGLLRRFSAALDDLREGTGRTREQQLLHVARKAVEVAVAELSGCFLTQSQRRKELNRRQNRKVTEWLLGATWTRKSEKDESDQESSPPEVCFDRIPLEDQCKPDPAFRLIEARLELDAYSRFLEPRECQLFSLLREDPSRRKASTRMKIAPATVDVMFGEIKKKIRAH